MQLRHVLATTDPSDLSARNVLVTGFQLARRAAARLTVLTVVEREDQFREASQRLERWVESVRSSSDDAVTLKLVARTGIPGVEICRFADEHAVDLIVVGRHRRTEMERLLIGDTADAVARRSRVPCLSLPADAGPPHRIHVALDGSHRGDAVLRTARDFAVWADARLTAVTVEPFLPDESLELALSVPSARTLSLQQELSTFTPDHPGLDVRRGPVVDSLLESLADARADTLAIGVHRGGPPGVAEAGSIARRMLHAAPCAVLTIPL